MATQICSYCKNPVKPGVKFCNKCGRAISAPTLAASSARITCPQCGAQNRAGAKYCARCRGALTAYAQAAQSSNARVRCPQCDALNRVGARFCVKCRSDLPARAPVVNASRRGAESERALFPRFAAVLAIAAALLLCFIASVIAWIATDGGAALIALSATATPGASLSRSPAAPNATPAPGVTPPGATGTWKQFDGTGYTLLYPAEWYAYQAPANQVDRTGARYDLILSDAPGNRSPQSATANESARVTVWYLPKAKQPLEEWVSQRWAWLDTTLSPVTIDDAPALTATSFSTEPAIAQEFFWIEYRGQYYIVQAYARADAPDALDKIKRIMDSLTLK